MLEARHKLRGKPWALAVLLDLVAATDKQTGLALVTQRGIMRRVGCSLRHAARAMAVLKRLGLVERVDLEARWPTGRRQVAYRVCTTNATGGT